VIYDLSAVLAPTMPIERVRRTKGEPEPAAPDTSTRERIEQDLRDQYAELALIAGGLAHEIKNPLSTIRLNLALLHEDLTDAEFAGESRRLNRVLQKLQVVQRECERLEGIVEEFLIFARTTEPQLEVCDLNALIAEIAEFVGPTLSQHKIELHVYPRSDLPLIRVDRDLLKQALLNLILNARDAMPEGGEIIVTLHVTPDGWCMINVIDTGEGIPREIQEKIFRPFYSTRRHGTGLGLPTVRRIVEAHGGTVTFESEPGRGSKFTISLPLREAESA